MHAPHRSDAQRYAAAVYNERNPGIAIVLEIACGVMMQTFGIGHIYAGNVVTGLIWMFGYWLVAAINFALCFLLIGFVTWPICFVGALVVSSIMAHNAVKTFNLRLHAQY